jgi:hypothetical protein
MERGPDDEPTAVSVGDGTLGGAAIGGSVTGPDAGVIHDPVGDDVAVPLRTGEAGEREAHLDSDRTAARTAGEPVTNAGGDLTPSDGEGAG